MTGYDIYKSSMEKLGLTDNTGRVEQNEAFKVSALEAINEMLADIISCEPIKNLSDEIKASIDNKTKSLISYGVAMILSVLLGDTEKNTVITAVFNAKRSAYLSKISKISDNSPKIYGV